jgi:copper resistance protein B
MTRPVFVLAIAIILIVASWQAPSFAQQAIGRAPAQDAENPASIPEPTEADRAAAFPDVEAHVLHGDSVHALVLFDELEWTSFDTTGLNLSWNTSGWLGGDRHRLRFRSEGVTEEGTLSDIEAHLLYSRAFTRWWDVVVGVRHNVRPGPAQTWMAFGVQGLAPYWFDVEATGYLSDRGQVAFRLKAEYEVRLTKRLMVEPEIEANLHGQTDLPRGVSAGFSNLETGLRVRYAFRPEFAPYLGVVWNNAFGAAAPLVGGPRFVTGIRFWF